MIRAAELCKTGIRIFGNVGFDIVPYGLIFNMLLIQNGFSCEYEMNVMMRLFFDMKEDVRVYTDLIHENHKINAFCEITYRGDIYSSDYSYECGEISEERLKKKLYSAACARSFCGAAKKIRNVSLPWGVMSGVRPAKAVTSLVNEGLSYDEAKAFIASVYGVTKEKCDLAAAVSKNERKLLEKIRDKSVSIYIGIPFCPSRCLYCSFVSSDIGISGKYMNDFVSLLCEEIKAAAGMLERLGLNIENIYIGGGTPTALDAQKLSKLLSCINESFDLSGINEFTLEAGRPDTVTYEKLSAAKSFGVDRVSINPQTTNDETLVRIGRKHDTKMFFDAFDTARKVGFKVINTDLIAGLPNESAAVFKKSIDDLVSLSPENITVHSMCVKRAAALRFSENSLTEAEVMNEMLSYAQGALIQNGYSPYYMYRQKNISGNLENVGYAKIGMESFYNVNIMEEAQTIIALGGGGTSKLVMDDRIERIFNFKDPAEYIRRFDDIIARKKQMEAILCEFYKRK